MSEMKKGLEFCTNVTQGLVPWSQAGHTVLLHLSWSGGSIFCRVSQDAPICVCDGCGKLVNT